MKKSLLIVFDGEGLPGIKTWKDVSANFWTDAPTKKLIETARKTLNKVVKGAEDAGFQNIIILDWHATAKNVPRNGIKRNTSTKLEILEGNAPNYKYAIKNSDCAILIGMHGKYGSADGKPPMHGKEFNKVLGVGHFWSFSISCDFFWSIDQRC